MSPRDIATKQIEAMKAAARKVWQEHEAEIDPDFRRDWRRLCWSHVCAYFSKHEARSGE